jgi:hypothetical protein
MTIGADEARRLVDDYYSQPAPPFGRNSNGGRAGRLGRETRTGTAGTSSNPKPPAPQPPATGATAGTPGVWTPPGSKVPTRAQLLAGVPNPVVANPATAWAVGENVVTSDALPAHWTGTAWATGVAAEEPEEAPALEDMLAASQPTDESETP